MVSSHLSRSDGVVRATAAVRESQRDSKQIDATDSQSDDLSAELRNLEHEEEEGEMEFDNCEISCKAPSARMSGRTIDTRHPSRPINVGVTRCDSRRDKNEYRQGKGSSRYTYQRPASTRDPPPPPPPPPQQFNSDDYECAKSSLSNKSVSTSKTPQEKALVTLLKEMRSLEQKLVSSNQNHAKERATLMDALTQQSNYIESLEKDLNSKSSALNELQKSQKVTLAKVFSQLNHFADGCSKFPSASVKKMSDALKFQVGDWSRAYKVSVNDCCNGINDDQEESSMNKIQALHLEIRELRQVNQTLSEKMRKLGRGGGSITSRSSVNYINSTEHSDEVSNFSGMTSTTKLADDMTGFLNDHELRTISPPVPGKKSHHSQSSGVSIESKDSASLPHQVITSNSSKFKHRTMRSQSPQIASTLRQSDPSKPTNSNTASSPTSAMSNMKISAKFDDRNFRPKKTVQMNITPQILCDLPRGGNGNNYAGHDERHHDGILKTNRLNTRKIKKPRPIRTSGFDACDHFGFGENCNYQFEDGESEV